MDDLIVFELPEKDPPSVDSFELLASNPTDQKEKNDKNKTETKNQNKDQNTNLIQLNNDEQHEENNTESNTIMPPDKQTSQQLPLKRSDKNSSTQETSEEIQSSFDEIKSDSLLQIPSPATVLRDNISPTQKSATNNQQQQLWNQQQSNHISLQQPHQISQQKSQQIPQHQFRVSQQHSLQIPQQQSMQIQQQHSILHHSTGDPQNSHLGGPSQLCPYSLPRPAWTPQP